MITSGRGVSRYDVVGVITNVYEDLGPVHRVSVEEINGKGLYTFDVDEFPFPANEVELLVGCTVQITKTVEVKILKTKEDTCPPTPQP